MRDIDGKFSQNFEREFHVNFLLLEQKRWRKCPSNSCKGSDNEKRLCNTRKCVSQWSSWTSAGTCSKSRLEITKSKVYVKNYNNGSISAKFSDFQIFIKSCSVCPFYSAKPVKFHVFIRASCKVKAQNCLYASREVKSYRFFRASREVNQSKID